MCVVPDTQMNTVHMLFVQLYLQLYDCKSFPSSAIEVGDVFGNVVWNFGDGQLVSASPRVSNVQRHTDFIPVTLDILNAQMIKHCCQATRTYGRQINK